MISFLNGIPAFRNEGIRVISSDCVLFLC